MKFQYNDGGRKAAGFTQKAKGDCVCRAIATATQRPYLEIYGLIQHFAKTERKGKRKRRVSNPETGVYHATERKIMAALGWEWVPTMGIGTGCRVHLRDGELPSGRLVVNVSKHFTAVIDGVIHDTFDPSRHGNRCVYGYYKASEKALKPDETLPLTIETPTMTQERTDGKNDATAPAKRRTRLKPATARYDEDGYKVMTYGEIKREAEAMIPPAFRPYYLGCVIGTDWNGHYTAHNSEIWLNFKRPVLTYLTDARYIHGSLEEIPSDLAELEIGWDTEDENESFMDYDEEHQGCQVVPIRAKYRPYNRDEATARWTNHEKVKMQKRRSVA